MIVTPDEMSAAEDALFATGVEAEPLMEKAGLGIARAAMQFHPRPGCAIAFVGDGHNGGDALVVLRHLQLAGWRVAVRLVNSEATLKPLTRKKLEHLGDVELDLNKATPDPGEGVLLIDGLLGIGARGELRPGYRETADEMNALRLRHGGRTLAVDIPSGLDGFTGEPHPGAVVADLTCTITYPKTGLLADAAVDHVGRIALVPLDEIVAPDGVGDSSALLAHPANLSPLLPRRAFDTHKGAAGRVGVIAGSPGMTGAAALCANAALRGGGGLVTIFSDVEINAAPEVMVKPLAALLDTEIDALAAGPGLGPEADVLLEFVSSSEAMVIDADGLNALARDTDLTALRDAAGPRVLTPHPGEMARLERAAGLDLERPRRERAEALAAHTECTVLLKGARTVIATPGEPTAFNPTGTPGMATPGVGDTLSGLIAALLAGGIAPHAAASIGSWLNGRAAEIALASGGQSEESLIAGDLPPAYGRAFCDLRAHTF